MVQSVKPESAQARPNASEEEWITLHRFDQAWKAHLARSYLESHDIPAMVPSDGAVGVYPGMPSSVSAVFLEVRKADAASAASLLDEAERARREASSERIERRRLHTLFRLVAVLLLLALTSQVLPVFALLLSVMVICLVLGFRVRGHLRGLGYEWVTVEESVWILLCAGRKIFRIPPAQDVELLPGCRRDADSLIAISRMMRKHRRGEI